MASLTSVAGRQIKIRGQTGVCPLFDIRNIVPSNPFVKIISTA